MIRTKIDESLEAVHTHTHTHTHIQHLYKCVLSCYAMVESVYSTEHNTSEIVFINHVKKIKKIKDKMDRLKISDKKIYGYLIFYSLSFL